MIFFDQRGAKEIWQSLSIYLSLVGFQVIEGILDTFSQDILCVLVICDKQSHKSAKTEV